MYKIEDFKTTELIFQKGNKLHSMIHPCGTNPTHDTLVSYWMTWILDMKNMFDGYKGAFVKLKVMKLLLQTQ